MFLLKLNLIFHIFTHLKRCLAEKNEYLKEAAQSVYVANADEMVRQKCLAREEAERHERTMKRNMNLLQQENAALKNDNSKLRKEAAYNTVQSIDNLMENLQLSLEKACETLGKTMEDYSVADKPLSKSVRAYSILL